MIENYAKMIYIHDNEVNNIAECNLLHDIINPHKRAKNINIHYSPILHVCMDPLVDTKHNWLYVYAITAVRVIDI